MNATNNYKKRVNNYKHDVCKMFLTQGLAKRKEGQIEKKEKKERRKNK